MGWLVLIFAIIVSICVHRAFGDYEHFRKRYGQDDSQED
jgi:hypothetical protein